MERIDIVILIAIVLVSLAICGSAFDLMNKDTSAPADGDDDTGTLSLIGEWNWQMGYFVTTKDVNDVQEMTEGDTLKITFQAGKLLHIYDDDVLLLASMNNDQTIICKHFEDDVYVDDVFFAPTDDIILRYVVSHNMPDDISIAGLCAYTREGAKVDNSVLDGYLDSDVAGTYVQNHVSTPGETEFTSKTSVITDLGHGLIRVDETLTSVSGETVTFNAVGFAYPPHDSGMVLGAYTHPQASTDRAVIIEFSHYKEEFTSGIFLYEESWKAESISYSTYEPTDAPDLVGLTLVATDGRTVLNKGGVEKYFESDFTLTITKQDGYCFEGTTPYYDVCGMITVGTNGNLMLEYECTEAGELLYFCMQGNLKDGFILAGGASIVEDARVISAKLTVKPS